MIQYIKCKISTEKGMDIINNKKSSIIDKLLGRKNKIFQPDMYYLPFYVYEYKVREDFYGVMAIDGSIGNKLIIDELTYNNLNFEEENKEHVIHFKLMEYETRNIFQNNICKAYYSKFRNNISNDQVIIKNIFPCYVPFLVYYILEKNQYSLTIMNGLTGKVDYTYKELVENKIISEKLHDKIVR